MSTWEFPLFWKVIFQREASFGSLFVTVRLHVPEGDEVCMVEDQLGGAGEYEKKNEELGYCLQLHILGGEEVWMVEDQFGDNEFMVM